MRHIAIGTAIGVTLACGAAACDGGPTQTTTRSIHLDNAESVSVNLKMGAGELHVDGGSANLLDASFRFNNPAWEPRVDYRRDGARGTLDVQQGSGSTSFGRNENTWDMHLNNSVPMDVAVDMGAGEATVTLGSATLEGLTIKQGAGEVTLDLRGTPKRSYDVRFNGGVGAAHIRLPRSVGIVATATHGLGSVNISGLQQQGDTWVNAGHEHDAVVVHLDAKGGVGEIEISAE